MAKILAVPKSGNFDITSSTKHVVSAPQNGVMFTTLSQEELRAAQKSGRIPNKEHFFSPFPRAASDDAKLGLFGKKEIPRDNKPVFLVGVKLPNSGGLRPVPHSTQMYTKNTAIPFSDITEIHEIRPHTESGFHQFRRMGGISKGIKGAEPLAPPSATPNPYHNTLPAHQMTPSEFGHSAKLLYHTGVSGPVNAPSLGERVMSIHSDSPDEPKAHQNIASWSQKFQTPESLDYNKDVIKKFLDAGTHHVYRTMGAYGQYPTKGEEPITSSQDFEEAYPDIRRDLADSHAVDSDPNNSNSAIRRQDNVYWHLNDKNYGQAQRHYTYGPHLDLRDIDTWKNDTLPYLAENANSEWDKALLEHAQTNIAHQDTYKNHGAIYHGAHKWVTNDRGEIEPAPYNENEPEGNHLRPDHSMWHFVDRSAALKQYLLNRGYTGATIPNFLSKQNPFSSGNELTMMANPHAISEPVNSGNIYRTAVHDAAHQNVINHTDNWDTPVPPSHMPLPDSYDNPVEPIAHVIRPKKTVMAVAKERLMNYGIAPKLTPGGYMSLDDWKDDGKAKWAEPHVATDVAKSAVATAFGVDPRIFNRTSMKYPAYEVTSDKAHAAGWMGNESLTVRQGIMAGARGGPAKRAYLYHTKIHEMIHSLQNEASGATTKEQDRRFRRHGFSVRKTPEQLRSLEGHTDLAAHIITSALLGKDIDNTANLGYPKYVTGLANQLRKFYPDNPEQGLAVLMAGAMNPMEHQISVPEEDPDAKQMSGKGKIDDYIDRMIAVARGESSPEKPFTLTGMMDRYKNKRNAQGEISNAVR